MHGALSPNELRNTFESEEGAPHALHILDLADVPYIDSAGLGLIVSHYVRCQGRGVRLVVAGVNGNPNGSMRDIAAIRNEAGNVVGVMPHPEHAVEALTGPSTDGLAFFTSVLKHLATAGAPA